MKSGRVLKKILKERGIKNNWVAKRLGIANSTFACRLDSELKILDVFKICEIIEMPVDEFCKRCKKEC